MNADEACIEESKSKLRRLSALADADVVAEEISRLSSSRDADVAGDPR